ncbi:hypothetical protein EIP91_004816 [Steccherinum ochraceum]|uniref:Peptidase S59 domain-containing protein n=1 Tax=Steccherinum ochraceum TaxID=92696 RepID=A0A4R0RAP3_9APHY|nr:hypothetical protein EIP91_004816 [Steccherinum ochraceum]
MFGNNAVSSAWGQPQQNQQQQQQQQGTSAFGQPANSTFGTAGAFGSGGAFGQPQQQQQQPAANPMFGNLGTTNTTPAFGGTGAFGATNNANTGGGMFGAPKTNTGFGAFSGGGGGGAFGGGNTGTGAFGSNRRRGRRQGQEETGGAFGAPATDITAPVTTGTSNPQYAQFDEKDTANANVTLHYQSITCMPAYRGSSFEELRLQDYAQGRKTAGAFGQTAFGATQPQPQQQSTGLFGQQPATTNPTTGGIFGGGGAFGLEALARPPLARRARLARLGRPLTRLSLQVAVCLGAAPSVNHSSNSKPNNPLLAPSERSGKRKRSLSSNSNRMLAEKPAFGSFGTTPSTTGGAFGSTSTFAQPAQQQNTGGLFGQTQQQPQQQQNTGFGGFGANNNAPKPSIFGSTQPAATTGFGSFGQTQQAQPGQQAAQPAGGLFGGGGGGLFANTQQQQQPQQQTGGLFGNTQPAGQQPAGGLFGNTTGGGLFGNNNAQQQQQNTQQQQGGAFGSIFGAKPAAPAAPAGGGLFGNAFGQSTTAPAANTNQAQGGLFSNLGQSTAQQPANTGFGGGLFGKPATTPGLGGLQNQSQAGTNPLGGGSLFGNLGASTNNAMGQPQGSLTASIAQPIGANLPIWNLLPPGPRTVPLEQQPKRKPGFFVDVPTRSPVPRLQLGYTPAPSKLRGFGSTNGVAPGSSLTFSSGNPNALSLSKSTAKALLGPEAFLNGSSGSGLGSGSKQSVKKLTLDKKVEPTDFFKPTASQSKVNFSPALSVAAREIEATSSPQRPPPAIAPAPQRTPNRFSAQGSMDAISPQKATEPADPQEGDYYVKPDLDTLRRLSYEELCSFDGLVVGRVGYGEIHFLEPVDLTGLPKLGSLLGQLIRFDDKECSVYPESDDVDKPPYGTGLNVKCRITLIRCWSLDKATREPIKDAKHPLAVRHLKRLKHMKNTHFEDFNLEEGRWTFIVDHF